MGKKNFNKNKPQCDKKIYVKPGTSIRGTLHPHWAGLASLPRSRTNMEKYDGHDGSHFKMSWPPQIQKPFLPISVHLIQ